MENFELAAEIGGLAENVPDVTELSTQNLS
jgi:hypothetical protein